ncbi:MAG: ligase-associated DNA damage response endonuclease PdeM [Bacteroidetes bacterium]|nr:ligase-associated DNA damage response endonuclease PdeM [Bacteroidota bacterium]
MPSFLHHRILDNNFLVTSERTMFWEEQRALIVSDLHIGKTGHFRKSGIPVPQSVLVNDMQRLISQIQLYKPGKLIIVGDLFHSEANKELDLFIKWRKDLNHVPVHLVKGNHDILVEEWYAHANVEVHQQQLEIDGFCFIHDVTDCPMDINKYYFSGHVHPGVTLRGMGKQSLHLSCFYFGSRYAILPAFGKFTGTFTIDPGKDDAVFGIMNNSVIRLN